LIDHKPQIPKLSPNLEPLNPETCQLKQGIYEGRNRACLGKNNQRAQAHKYNDNGEQPVALPELQKLPELTDERLIGHG